jgi:hypothetical protein
MKTLFTTLLCFAFAFAAFGQEEDTITHADYMKFTTEKFDSVTITYGLDINRENTLPLDGIERDTFIIKGVAQLSKSEIKELHRWLLSEKSFLTHGVLLRDGDIVISYYKNDTIAVSCAVSTHTRKFAFLTLDGEHYFNKSVSPAFEKYLTALLRKKKLWSKKEGFVKWE